jgi:putative DNA primase/helicase
MREAGKILIGIGCQVRFCAPPADTPEGWDLADADPSVDWLAYLRENLTDELPAAAVQVTEQPAEQVSDQVSANDNLPALTTSQSVDFYSPLPDANDRGKPLATIENLQEVCRRLGVTVRYNVISKEEEILIPDESFSLDNQANASLAWMASWCARFRMPTEKLGDFVTYLADKNLHNPVAEWIISKPWDGKSRLPDLCATIKSNDDPLKEVLLRRWLVSAVAAAFDPHGVSAHGVLVLQGDQYLGKTKWFKQLVPAHLGVVQDGMMLRPDDRDSVKQVCSFWLVELGELDATFRKSDIAALKSFITRKNDVLRRAYARKESQYARRTVFFGSVNPKQFLHDSTGNRRYWTIEATDIDHSHTVDMQQLWAEMLALWKAGETYYLQPEEMARLNEHNEDFTVSDPVHERLQTRLDWAADKSHWEWRSATDTLIECGIERPNQSDVTKAAHYILENNGKHTKRTSKGRMLFIPPKVSQASW